MKWMSMNTAGLTCSLVGVADTIIYHPFVCMHHLLSPGSILLFVLIHLPPLFSSKQLSCFLFLTFSFMAFLVICRCIKQHSSSFYFLLHFVLLAIQSVFLYKYIQVHSYCIIFMSLISRGKILFLSWRHYCKKYSPNLKGMSKSGLKHTHNIAIPLKVALWYM